MGQFTVRVVETESGHVAVQDRREFGRALAAALGGIAETRAVGRTLAVLEVAFTSGVENGHYEFVLRDGRTCAWHYRRGWYYGITPQRGDL
jgi:hypothetical protein